MTREEARKAAEVMLAYANGEEIETICFEDYIPCENPSFNWIDGKGIENYRIKPKPKYRPFKSQEECWNEMLKHQPFGFLSIADKHDYFSICRVFEEEGKPKIWLTNNTYGDCDMTTAFVIFQFIDGTPFGINKEE